MPQEAFCPEHGPYDASLGACPYPHSGAQPRPQQPRSLDEEETDVRRPRTASTLPPEQDGDEGKTQMPEARRYRRGDFDEDETQPPLNGDIEVTELDSPITPTLALLWAIEGPRRGKYYPISKSTTIGRNARKQTDLCLDYPNVSAQHAKFTVENDGFVLWDLGSANGTYVNGKKIREATTLQENDRIKIGESVFVVKLLESKPKRKIATTPAKQAKKVASKKSRKAS